MTTKTRRPTSTHYYRPDPNTPDRCNAPGLYGRVCGLPESNARHQVRAIDPAITSAEARRIGEHE